MLASDQEVDLVLLGAPASLLDEGVFDPDLTVVLADMPCDVAVLVTHEGQSAGVDADRPVVVPFGGAEHEWAAVEIGAWLAARTGRGCACSARRPTPRAAAATRADSSPAPR